MAQRTLNTHEGINTTLISDCNDAIIPGITYYANDNTINKPTSGWFHVNCINRLNNYLTQIAIAMNISSNSPMWIRTNNSNHNWSSWQKY